MTRILVDSELLERLQGLNSRLEFCDPSGRVLGVFQPASSDASKRLLDDSPFTREDLEEFRKQQTGRPLADILRDLGAK